jgi:hypothetical protein
MRSGLGEPSGTKESRGSFMAIGVGLPNVGLRSCQLSRKLVHFFHEF